MKLFNEPQILAATYNPVSNTRMISFLVDFPTVLLAELRTHRILTQGSLYEHFELLDFNLSANSARAIPHNKYLEKVLQNPFVPIWTKQQRGMSGGRHENQNTLTTIWIEALEVIKKQYEQLVSNDAHKQNANRLLAPFAYTTCIISGTEWDNFWNLRISENAQPEFKEIASMLKTLYDNANWKVAKYHIPFEEIIDKLYLEQIRSYVSTTSTTKDIEPEITEIKMRISASMCAKLSYNTQYKEDSLEKHLERSNMLISHKHWEPFSHQAIAMNKEEYETMFIQRIVQKNGKREIVKELGVAYNLRGFISQRYIIENLMN
ncbi:MAG: FAD-dependent thymidylate synthase [Candidatus Dojkabacteria bacterium]|nr:FAD-dependent thymidylate synthase [Candidatus Dojkabacteria bacterium]